MLLWSCSRLLEPCRPRTLPSLPCGPGAKGLGPGRRKSRAVLLQTPQTSP